ncbi:MAG: hypothetical protein ABI237_01125 [Ginsengibacter sp.]
MRNSILKLSGAFLLLFGMVSVFMTTSVLLDLFGIRKIEGNYVPFVVYANLICGILYLFSGYGFWKEKKWTTRVLFIAACILIVTFSFALVYISEGGIYETKMVKAMTFRTIITIVLTGVSWKYISEKIPEEKTKI